MEFNPVIICLFVSIVIYYIVHKLVKNKKPLKRAFISTITGPCTLILVNSLGCFIGVGIPVSILTIIISIALGIPGIIGMLMMNLFF